MKLFKSFQIHFAAGLVTLLTAHSITFAAGAGGGVGTGGGDSASDRLRVIRRLFEHRPLPLSNEKHINVELENILITMDRFSTQGKLHAQIKDILKKGLIEDIEKSEINLSSDCRDEFNIERSASTLKVNISNQANVGHPDICVNTRKLAAENASFAEILGLLLHEHARHFGLEDTTDGDFHPLADFIAEKYDGGLSDIAQDLGTDAGMYYKSNPYPRPSDYKALDNGSLFFAWGNNRSPSIYDPDTRNKLPKNALYVISAHYISIRFALKQIFGGAACMNPEFYIDSYPVKIDAWKYSNKCFAIDQDKDETALYNTQRCLMNPNLGLGVFNFIPENNARLKDYDHPSVRLKSRSGVSSNCSAMISLLLDHKIVDVPGVMTFDEMPLIVFKAVSLMDPE